MTNEMDVSGLLKNLFKAAESEGGIDYIFALVRLNGMSCLPDPLIEFQSALRANYISLSKEELLSLYCSVATVEAPLSLVANLLNCTLKKPYDISPFDHLYTGQFPDIVKPTPSQIAKELIKIAKETDRVEIAEMIETAYPEDVLLCCSTASTPNIEYLQATFQNCRTFLSSLLEIYNFERLKYREQPRFYKLVRFEVLELLVNREYGLYGFRIHFSNGNRAEFIRNPDSTKCINIELRTPINFMVGDLDGLKDEWRIGEKRLYEIGLPGRYNQFGGWKPIIYPGDSSQLQEEARSLPEDDDVQGVLFYMMCTGHRVVEFVVRTTMELPTDYVAFGEKIYLWKCPPLQEGQNIFIYDGWMELESSDPEYIKMAIATISVSVNRMAFVFGAAVDWRLKYRMTLSSQGYATPSEDDLGVINSFLIKFPSTEDAFVLDAAIDWFNRGRTSRNIFTSFLCYYTAFESVAVAVTDGHADFGLGYSGENKTERNQKRIECIKQKYDEIYSKDPVKFVSEAYFDCVTGLKKKTQYISELIFGTKHEYLRMLFEKRDGYSLNDIRGKIAHGGITHLNKEEEMLVKNRLHEIAQISKEFLLRVTLLLKPTDPLPSWSGLHRVNFATTDPRTIMVATTDKIFPSNDWRIRPEWCE